MRCSQDDFSTLVQKAQKRLYFLWKSKKAKFPSQTVVSFHRGETESILLEILQIGMVCLQWVIKTTQTIIGAHLPNISEIGIMISKDNTHPNHRLLLSGKQYGRIHCHTTTLQSSFFPELVRLLNSSSALNHTQQFFLCSMKGLQLAFHCATQCCTMTNAWTLNLPVPEYLDPQLLLQTDTSWL